MFLYGDIYPDCNLSDFINSDTGKVCHLCIHKSSHPEDSDLIYFKDNLLQSVIKKPHNFKDGFAYVKLKNWWYKLDKKGNVYFCCDSPGLIIRGFM